MRHERISVRQSAVDTAVEQLRCWSEQGGIVLFGTDYGAVPADPSREYLLMRLRGSLGNRRYEDASRLEWRPISSCSKTIPA